MAVTLDDVLRRRVPIAFRHADGGAAVAADAGALMGAALGWDADETATEVERYRTGVADELRRRAEPAASPDVAVDSRRRA
jgi:glycerol-3-phosphate dehydrogenase